MLNSDFNKSFWLALRTWPSEWRTQVFYTHSGKKDLIQFTVYAVINNVDVRLDWEISEESLKEILNPGIEIARLIKMIIDSDIEEGVIEEIRKQNG